MVEAKTVAYRSIFQKFWYTGIFLALGCDPPAVEVSLKFTGEFVFHRFNVPKVVVH